MWVTRLQDRHATASKPLCHCHWTTTPQLQHPIELALSCCHPELRFTGAKPGLLASQKSDNWEQPRQHHRPPLSSLRPTPGNQQASDSQVQPEASSSFTHWLSHDSMPGSGLQPTRSDAGSYMASHLGLSGVLGQALACSDCALQRYHVQRALTRKAQSIICTLRVYHV